MRDEEEEEDDVPNSSLLLGKKIEEGRDKEMDSSDHPNYTE